jgi:hypothetical protein
MYNIPNILSIHHHFMQLYAVDAYPVRRGGYAIRLSW